MNNSQIKREINTVILRCYNIAKKKWPEIYFPSTTLDIDTLEGSIAGKAFFKTNVIQLNYNLLLKNYERFLKITIPHECGHLISWRVFGENGLGHGDSWMTTMKILGIENPTVCHSYITREFPYICNCKTYYLNLSEHLEVRKREWERICKKCGETLKYKSKLLEIQPLNLI